MRFVIKPQSSSHNIYCSIINVQRIVGHESQYQVGYSWGR